MGLKLFKVVTCQLKGLLFGARGLIVRVGPEEKSTCLHAQCSLLIADADVDVDEDDTWVESGAQASA